MTGRRLKPVADETLVDQRPAVPWDKLVLREPDAAELLGESERGLRELVRHHGMRRKQYPDGEYRYFAYDVLGVLAGADSEGPRPQQSPHSDGRDVYFVQPEGGGPIKIGSTSNLARRLDDLRHASPAPLEVLFVWRGAGTASERALHALLSEYRSHGEWFYDAPAVRLCLKRVKSLPLDFAQRDG